MLISLNNIEKGYGAHGVLQGVTIRLHKGDKVGLIGPNGSGKSTLVKIMAGELEPDKGSVHRARGLSCGYLPQDFDGFLSGTLRRFLEESLGCLLEMKGKLAALEQEISQCPPEAEGRLQRLLERYGELSREFQEKGGYTVEARIAAVARGLGFQEADLDQELSTFSGGEKTRAKLASLLLQQPDLLLLDEPTNFLDLAGLEWLERFLQDWPGSLLVVSHDRFFLDRVVKGIFLLEGGKIKSYPGGYSTFEALRRQERLAQEKAYREQQLLLAREEKRIRESKADARSKKQARSRRHRLEKVERVEQPRGPASFKLGLDYAGRGGDRVLALEGVSKSYGDRQLFHQLNLEVRWGDRVAVVGPNGAGKTTLLKLIIGEEQPSAGRIRLGPSVRVVYFAQEQESLDPEQTLLEAVMQASDLDLKEARNHLGRYLFRGDQVFQRVKELSGGEKSRLALACLALSRANCLLMDEPTSHLDLSAVEELEEALSRYPGTLIVVSHDRYFLSKLVNRVWEVNAGEVQSFAGTFQEYLQRREEEARQEKTEKAPERAALRRREAQQRERERQRRESGLRREQEALEESIAAAEAKIARLEQQLSRPELYGSPQELSEKGLELLQEQEKLAGLLRRWEEVSLLLEKLS
ncbi:MAG TPA: ABC-F family ATP-binding cassette domain-containing protein [Bacillota bacterium]|jgi:ATP-binding cassette subfamily F protein 3|nr:ABC-F family ATP-binding cassette domain-containing protein [Bacillota bacterium]HOB86997.1 ABC-F family ATP-binding cassette domain-containing protein [Bacillota bacterium]HOP69573.1 ABC-F family ATP-binding cassette domain-containing protein [Bacillota bacterium]HPT34183.1 ABC-F family ATP-binding cassette domain-containing protein [Bacillota bacterium]HQD05968.1 ABC-F family ATP-binding cassette domain-containing protein [Bacillota bacterium]